MEASWPERASELQAHPLPLVLALVRLQGGSKGAPSLGQASVGSLGLATVSRT